VRSLPRACAGTDWAFGHIDGVTISPAMSPFVMTFRYMSHLFEQAFRYLSHLFEQTIRYMSHLFEQAFRYLSHLLCPTRTEPILGWSRVSCSASFRQGLSWISPLRLLCSMASLAVQRWRLRSFSVLGVAHFLGKERRLTLTFLYDSCCLDLTASRPGPHHDGCLAPLLRLRIQQRLLRQSCALLIR
jgi:hypothetical protein